MGADRSFQYTPFSVDLVPNRHEVVAMVAGELDLASATDVRLAVDELRDAGFSQIVVDLSGVDFIDSAGLQILLGLRNDAEREGRKLTLVRPQRSARRIFELTRSQELFDWRERSAAR